MYIIKFKSLAREFESITISQMPRHDVEHVDTLVYLTEPLEADSPCTIQIDIQEDRSIERLSTKLSIMYISKCSFTSSLPEAVFAVNKVITRK